MTISIRLDAELVERLERLAAATGRSKTFYIREAVESHLEELEDIYLAEREIELVRAGRSATTPLADILKAHGVVD